MASLPPPPPPPGAALASGLPCAKPPPCRHLLPLAGYTVQESGHARHPFFNDTKRPGLEAPQPPSPCSALSHSPSRRQPSSPLQVGHVVFQPRSSWAMAETSVLHVWSPICQPGWCGIRYQVLALLK